MSVPHSVLSDVEHRRHLRRAVLASTIGTAIEWYDFFLYGTVTGLVFAPLFFPHADPLTSSLEAFAVFAVGFASRPIGAIIFGHYGDRLGRKAALIATLLLMGVATFLVAFVPTYARIGIWGGAILTVLRFVQGIGVGGEWGGSVLLAMEWARTNRHRGFIASWPQLGVPAGLFLSNLAVLTFSRMSGSHFLEWGWRIPFLLSGVLIGIGMYIRLGILETPVFARLAAEQRLERAPVLEVIRRQPREIILTALCRMGEQGPFSIASAFVFAYGTGALHIPRDLLLYGLLTATVISFFAIPFAGHLSDRFGRKRIYMLGAALMGVWGFLYFGLLDTRVPALVFLAVASSLLTHDLMYGPQAALIAESFGARVRYSGASLGYQLSSLIAGGPAPLIATWLLARYQSGTAIAVFILVSAIVSLVSTSMLHDYTNRDAAE